MLYFCHINECEKYIMYIVYYLYSCYSRLFNTINFIINNITIHIFVSRGYEKLTFHSEI